MTLRSLALRAAVSALALCALAPAIERKTSACDLATAKRVFIEQLGGGQNSDQMRDMIISAIQNSGLFIVTENQESADATIRGSADDKIYTENHTSSDSIGLHTGSGSGSSSHNYSSGTSDHKSLSAGITDSESSHVEERRHEASASLRMVNADGDVIWSTTQESGGGKFRGAMSDVAERITRQLSSDVKKARASEAAAGTGPGSTLEVIPAPRAATPQ
ncbi:MAG TPA: hypothetical protein VG273_26020 [Bryobacteraceae bacterium]|jgi:hypothetical protein|nr:hypothetical protein [Bryobacteraceae bacterium]